MMDIPAIFTADTTGLGLLWVAFYAGLLGLYFIVGSGLGWLNARHPDRRIQDRPPSDRRRDIRQSVLSLATIAFYLAAGLWMQARGWGLWPAWEPTWWSLLGGVAVSLVLYDAWFYWFHRLMHTRLLYRFHSQHHVSVTPTPWSNNNDTLVGTFFEQAYFLVAPLVLPFPAAVFIAHKIWDQITGMIGHSGYEFFASPQTRKPWPGVCTLYHDQHHSHFRFNYANTFTFWDRLCGTLHPSYDRQVERLERLAQGNAK